MTILITGASRGIGAELALNLSDGNHKLILVARNGEDLHQVAGECNRIADSEVAFPLRYDLKDLLKEDNGFREKLQKHTEVLDILVNNAGLLIRKPLEEFTSVEMRSVFDINVIAPTQLTRLCLPLLKHSSDASVINISSMAGMQGSRKFSGMSVYSASKGALTALTECLAEEFKGLNVRVNGLALGAVQTEMFAEAFPGYEATASAAEMGQFLAWFVKEGWRRFNGKVLPVSDSTP